jgi:hypothetical protein
MVAMNKVSAGGFSGVSFHLRRCPQGVASVLCKKTPIFGSRRSKLDNLTVAFARFSSKELQIIWQRPLAILHRVKIVSSWDFKRPSALNINPKYFASWMSCLWCPAISKSSGWGCLCRARRQRCRSCAGWRRVRGLQRIDTCCVSGAEDRRLTKPHYSTPLV